MPHRDQSSPGRAPWGKVVLFGSGETAPAGRRVHERVMAELPRPVNVGVLETPAGFQPNSDLVAQEVADFLADHVPNVKPRITVIPARKKGTAYSPDDPALVAPILQADYIYLGAGSPTYAARHLSDTLALRHLFQRHGEGAAVALASAAAIAMGAHALPVYELYKVGEDLHWRPGLDLLGRFGLELAVLPHWNNTDGGATLDTSRCFMGRDRMETLRRMLPETVTVFGIDEHTAAVFDFQTEVCEVEGKGGVTLIDASGERVFPSGARFPLSAIAGYRRPPPPPVTRSVDEGQAAPADLVAEVERVLQERQAAREAKDFARADALRDQLAAMGVRVQDSRSGPVWTYEPEE